jgi:hypothetical protein
LETPAAHSPTVQEIKREDVMRRSSQKGSFIKRMVSSLALALIAVSVGIGQNGAFDVAGVVIDTDGALIAEAQVIVRKAGGRPEQTKKTNQKGEFRFTRLASGDYEIEVQREGFKPTVTKISLSMQNLAPMRIVLPIADVREEISVVDQANKVNTNPDDNLNVIKLDSTDLKNLPVLGNDIVATVANLADASSLGTGGVQVIVDGIETTNKVPANQVKEIRINQNPYSAEFARPGRGRIEIITKPGASQYHGEFSFVFRDYHLDARNFFADTRPPERRGIFEGSLTGPIGNGKRTSFFFSANREQQDLQAIIFAHTPSGDVSENVDTPQRQTEFSIRLDHQYSEKTTMSFRYSYSSDSAKNNGVGGFNLPEVASNSTGLEQQIFFNHRRLISSTLVNEFTIRAGRENQDTRGVQIGLPLLIIKDSFTTGGSQSNRRATENHVQLNEILSWTHGKHFIRTGLNIPDLSRRGLSDQSNFGGTFVFNNVTDFLDNKPSSFSINQGNGFLVYWQKEFGFFFQDNFTVRPNLSFGLGLRYDKQNFINDNNNFSPRLSYAYSPDQKHKTVLRGGIGIFYDRTGAGPMGDILRFNGQRLLQIDISNPTYPNPFLNAGAATLPLSIVRFAPDLRSPYTIQFNTGVERELKKGLTLSANYINTRGVKLFRSRDINAPIAAPFLVRPDAATGVLRQIESTGHAQTHAMELILRGKINRYFNGTVQYNLGRAYNNTGGINSRPANNYDLTGEWSRADFDEQHRFNILGAFKTGEWINIGMNLYMLTGRHNTIKTGTYKKKKT